MQTRKKRSDTRITILSKSLSQNMIAFLLIGVLSFLFVYERLIRTEKG
jgi:hypothetical protein